MKPRAPLVLPSDLLLACALLSRLPVPEITDWSRQAQAAWAYPLVGGLLGALAAAVGWLAGMLGLPDAAIALITLAALILFSGAMHEDGLADTADGFWGGWTVERRLAIMKDSQIGSYGVIALVLSLGARWSALTALWSAGAATAIPAIIAAAALSRAVMPLLMSRLTHARDTGLSQSVGAVPGRTSGTALALAGVMSLLLLGTGALWPLILAILATVAMGILAQRKIGGQTGDVLGATQQLAEIAILFCLIA